MEAVLAQVHYLPTSWKGQAHTTKVNKETKVKCRWIGVNATVAQVRTGFAELFQYKAVYLLEELVSPLVTPLVLCCSLHHKALDIVDFLRHFTVEVVGVGDVCSFAQLDLHKHGQPQWQTASVERSVDHLDAAASSSSTTSSAAAGPAPSSSTSQALVRPSLSNPRFLFVLSHYP